MSSDTGDKSVANSKPKVEIDMPQTDISGLDYAVKSERPGSSMFHRTDLFSQILGSDDCS